MSAVELKVAQTNQAEEPSIINLNGKEFDISVDELKDFFIRCSEVLGIHSKEDFECALMGITELVIEGVDDNKAASELKRPLKLLNELNYLFKGVLVEKNVDD